jgi:hypothetical protein
MRDALGKKAKGRLTRGYQTKSTPKLANSTLPACKPSENPIEKCHATASASSAAGAFFLRFFFLPSAGTDASVIKMIFAITLMS